MNKTRKKNKKEQFYNPASNLSLEDNHSLRVLISFLLMMLFFGGMFLFFYAG